MAALASQLAPVRALRPPQPPRPQTHLLWKPIRTYHRRSIDGWPWASA